MVASVTLRACTTAASAASRSSAIDAIPTFVLPYSPPAARVRAVKSDVFPLPGGPTMPTSSGTAEDQPFEPKPTRLSRAKRFTYTTRRSSKV